jgi:AraC-like DNA-binding protein
MDLTAKIMDSTATEWGTYRRRFPSPFPLGMVDYLRPKYHWIRVVFGTCNFSLILRGQGEYWRLGRKWVVQSPCVITQWPGEQVEYGPSGPEGRWDELYLMYGAHLFPEFQKQHLLSADEPVWPIRNLPAVESQIQVLLSLLASPAPAQVVDRVDRVCEQLILETHLEPSEPAGSSEEALLIRRIERELLANLDREIDLEELVARNGMSMRTFRRRWAELITVPPAHHRLKARLREACRLLTQTNRPIYEIARTVGFADELYFSRRFHQEIGVSPRIYRQMHELDRGMRHQG